MGLEFISEREKGGHAGAEERQGKKDILGTDRMKAQGG